MNTKYVPNYNAIIKEVLEYKGTFINDSNFSFNFHHYSFLNVLIAWSQLGDKFGQLGTYKTWQKLGRQVKKGERAIAMRIPCPFKDKQTGDDGVFFLFKNAWFSVHQTEKLSGASDIQDCIIPQFDRNQCLAKLDIELVPYNKGINHAHGYVGKDKDGFKLALNPMADQMDQNYTLLHELAHVVLGHHGDSSINHNLKEFEAELTALFCAKTLGLEIGGNQENNTKLYIQRFNDSSDKNYQRIFKAVDTILRAGTGVYKEQAMKEAA